MFTDYPTHSSFSVLLTARKLAAGAGIMSAGPNLYQLPYASCLIRGAKIGPSAQFGSAVTVERSSGGLYGAHYRFGKWGGSHPNRFMGVKVSDSRKDTLWMGSHYRKHNLADDRDHHRVRVRNGRE